MAKFLKLLISTSLTILLLASCSSSSNDLEAIETGNGNSQAKQQWSEIYDQSLHPYLLFLNVSDALVVENRLTAECMRERGWTDFPLPEQWAETWKQLSQVQSVDERAERAKTFANDLFDSGQVAVNAVRPYDEFWAGLSAEEEQQFSADLGASSEDDGPGQLTEGSCKAEASLKAAQEQPGSNLAVEMRAGELYGKLIIDTDEYKAAEANWYSCMEERGFPSVGGPMMVVNQDLQIEVSLARSGDLDENRKAEIARVLNEQAVAEHECATQGLDEVVHNGELRVVEALVEEFPEYSSLVTG